MRAKARWQSGVARRTSSVPKQWHAVCPRQAAVRNCEVLEFPTMRSNPQSAQSGFNPQRHGNVAQWVAIFVAIGIALLGTGVNSYLTVHYHDAESQKESGDDHVKRLIRQQLDPSVEKTNNNISALGDKVSKLDDRVATLEGRFEQLDSEQKRLTKLELNRLSSQIDAALESRKIIDVGTITEFGDSLLPFTKSTDRSISDTAWRATAKLAGYRSFVNSYHSPDTSQATSLKPSGVETTVEFRARKLPDAKEVILGVLYLPNQPVVHGSQSAMFVRIGDETKVVRAPLMQVVEGRGVEITLDGFHVRNSIIKDAHISYNGGPLILQNVYFVNCVFTITHTSAGASFAQSIVASSSIATHFSTGL